MHLVAIASGPGVTAPYWPIPRTYQPTSPDWQPYVIGSTGPVWLDADGDGKWTSAYDYATLAWANSRGAAGDLIKELAGCDAATAVQAASLLARRGRTLLDADLREALQQGSEATREGFGQYFEAWKKSQAARAAAR